VRPEAKEVVCCSATSLSAATKMLDAYAGQNQKYLSGSSPADLKDKITAANPQPPAEESAATGGGSRGWTEADDY